MIRLRQISKAALILTLSIVLGASSVAMAQAEQEADLLKIGPARMSKCPVEKSNARLVLAYIAGKAEVDLETLLQELKTGKTLEEIAASFDVTWDEIQSLIEVSRPQRDVVSRLETRLSNLNRWKERLEERVEKESERLDQAAQRIEEIENPTTREFAERHLELADKRLELAKERLEILIQEIDLTEDELAHARSML